MNHYRGLTRSGSALLVLPAGGGETIEAADSPPSPARR
jgi:hypothetical protein